MKAKTVLIFSGGLDSTTLLYRLLADGRDVHAMTVNYGQRHSVEIEHAAQIARRLGIDHRVADLSGASFALAGSSQTNNTIPVPEGHYAAESMKQTVVPNRNMIMLAVAAAWAMSIGAKELAYGAQAGDNAIYPDCRPEFYRAMNEALGLADWRPVKLTAPFIELSKADVVRMGDKLGVPFALTWSCYRGEDTHCGRCGTCVERAESFHLAGVADPTVYADPDYWRAALKQKQPAD